MVMHSSVTSLMSFVESQDPNAMNDPMAADSYPELNFLLNAICTQILSGVNPPMESPVNGIYMIHLISLKI